MDEIFQISVDQMFELLFADSDFNKAFYKERKTFGELQFNIKSPCKHTELNHILLSTPLNGCSFKSLTELDHCAKWIYPSSDVLSSIYGFSQFDELTLRLVAKSF